MFSWGFAPHPTRSPAGPQRPAPAGRAFSRGFALDYTWGFAPHRALARVQRMGRHRLPYQRITFISSMFTVSLFLKSARRIPSPTAASAAATAMTNTTNT